jgi:hypothetical protein
MVSLVPRRCADTSPNWLEQPATRLPPLNTRVEMFQKGHQESFFNMKALAPRPMSTATEMFDTDFEDDDNSDIEEDYSPRISLNSVCSHSRRYEIAG